ELKALRAHPECTSEICDDALELFLHFSYVPAPYSIYRGVYKLQPGCLLYVRGTPPSRKPDRPLRPGSVFGTIELVKYWDASDRFGTLLNSFGGSQDDAIDLVEKRLAEAIKRQMLADVPLGAFLSGGVDSSLVVAMMQSQSIHPVKTFTVGFH
ncbi:MAG: asparagine synthase-related protein, partial [Dolichospermum sp.]